MQTTPSSVGNNVKLAPLQASSQTLAYRHGFINLKYVEPSLGIPPGYTLVKPNTAYYFPVFASSQSLSESRRFTGYDSLVFVNKNLGYNTDNPTFNVDISGSLRALSALFINLSASLIVPASGSNTLYFNYSDGVVFNTDLSANYNTYLNNATANNLFVYNLTANRYILQDIYTVYHYTGVNADQDVVIGGDVSAQNVFVQDKTYTNYICANSANFISLTANNITITNTLSVQNDIYADQIYGQVQIDPFSGLYYDQYNRLSIIDNQVLILAVRPSDDYSTDDPNAPRTPNGDWWSKYGLVTEDSNVSRPYFKTLNGAINYIYKNGVVGNQLNIYVDEDIVEGERPPNYFTTDDSGNYSGCTIVGNLTSGFYSTEWLGSHYPALTTAGLQGGDFIWAYDKNIDISGMFSYISMEEIQFSSIYIIGRYLHPNIVNNNTLYYSTWRSFDQAPRKISFRTYICADPNLSYGQFYSTTPNISTWTAPRTKSLVQGRQVSFNPNTTLSIRNLCFEFNTNSMDSTALVFYSGQFAVSNTTVALLGKGIYTYGAMYINSSDAHLQVNGINLGDPFMFSDYNNWNKYGEVDNWVYKGGGVTYNFGSPNYFPGYGLAIVGNPTYPTIINYGVYSQYGTGFINVNGGGFYDQTDYGTVRNVGRNSFLQNSIILDGKFNATSFYSVGDRSQIQGIEQVFITNNFDISSRNTNPHNLNITSSFILDFYDDPTNILNFKYINYNGAFSNFGMYTYGYTNWAFLFSQNANTLSQSFYFSRDNGGNDPYYVFGNSNTVSINNSLTAIGKLNSAIFGGTAFIYTPTSVTFQTVDYKNLLRYDTDGYYTLFSPYNIVDSYTLNYYQPSVR